MPRFLIIAALLISLSFLLAHAPSEMEISFDQEEGVLTIVALHNVGNPGNHYVDQVTISQESNQLIVHKISKQDDNDKVTLIYRIPDTESGMKLNIVVSCNRIGKLSREFTIE